MMRGTTSLIVILFTLGSTSGVAHGFSIESFIDPFLSMANENDGFVLSDTADQAARLFLSYINSTTTISPSYALVIILGISFALLILLGLAYLFASAAFTGTAVSGGGFGKRSLSDTDESSVGYEWARILQILDQMEEHFQRLGAEKKHQEDCRQRLICELSLASRNGTIINQQDEDQMKLIKLTNELSDLYKKRKTDDLASPSSTHNQATAYYRAKKQGDKHGQCETAFPKCFDV